MCLTDLGSIAVFCLGAGYGQKEGSRTDVAYEGAHGGSCQGKDGFNWKGRRNRNLENVQRTSKQDRATMQYWWFRTVWYEYGYGQGGPDDTHGDHVESVLGNGFGDIKVH